MLGLMHLACGETKPRKWQPDLFTTGPSRSTLKQLGPPNKTVASKYFDFDIY